MLNNITNYIKNNKLTSFLILVLIYLFAKDRVIPFGITGLTGRNTMYYSGDMMAVESAPAFGGATMAMKAMPAQYNAAPTPEIAERKVVTTSSISLQVKDVTDTVNLIKNKVQELKGYVVTTSIERPEVSQFGLVQVRIPSEQVNNTLAYLRSLSIKVVSENITGNDITDQYVDIQERITRLEVTKSKLQAILDRTDGVDQILKVQQNIFSVQDQIDSWKGQLHYLNGASSTSLITINLSTDEVGLPYVEPLSWRPDVIFEHAVRSLLMSVQKLGTVAIWLAVYSVIILPALLVFFIVRNWWKSRTTTR